MKELMTIKDSDVGSDLVLREDFKYKTRQAVRAVVFDKDNKIALLHVRKLNYYKLPGGGIDDGEETVAALRRECLEEIGCKIEIGREVGRIIEYRNQFKLLQTSDCYLAKLVGEPGEPNLEEDEEANGFVTLWVDLDQATELLRYNPEVEYEGRFILKRDLRFVQEVKNNF